MHFNFRDQESNLIVVMEKVDWDLLSRYLAEDGVLVRGLGCLRFGDFIRAGHLRRTI